MIDDEKLIKQLGGPSKLAGILGYDKHGGVQRVQNWLSRGIPPKVKLAHPDIFPNPIPTESPLRATAPADDQPES